MLILRSNEICCDRRSWIHRKHVDTMLLKAGHNVVVPDNLMFGGQSLLPYFIHPSFNFIELMSVIESGASFTEL